MAQISNPKVTQADLFNLKPHHVIEGAADSYSKFSPINQAKGVYEATAQKTNAVVAVKIKLLSNRKGIVSQETLQYYKNEAQICAIDHKNVVKIFDAFSLIYDNKTFGVVVIQKLVDQEEFLPTTSNL